MPPKNKYKTKGVELKIDFGSGSNPEVVTPVRQVQYAVKSSNPISQPTISQPKMESPFDMLEEEKSQRQQQNLNIVDTTKQPQKPEQKQAQQSKNYTNNQQIQMQQNRQIDDGLQEQSQIQTSYEKREPEVNQEMAAELFTMLNANDEENVQMQIPFTDALNDIYEDINIVLKSCPKIPEQELPSHRFGQQHIQPIVPPLVFELGADQQTFDAKFGRVHPMPQGQVLKQLLDVEDMMLYPNMLDSLFEFDITELKKQSACASIKFDTAQMISPKLNCVYRGIAGFRDSNVLSCTTLAQESQVSQMEHNLFSGQITSVTYKDDQKSQDFVALNDDTEIDDLLKQAFDPFDDTQSENNLDLIAEGDENLCQELQIFLQEFKSSVMQQKEASEHLKSVKQKIQEQEFNQAKQKFDEHAESDSEQQSVESTILEQSQVSQTITESKEHTQSAIDEIDEITGSSSTYLQAISLQGDKSVSVQAEPSRFNLAVVAKERRGQDGASQKLQDIAKTSDQQWVIKDTLDMKNFKDLIPDPALEYNFELDDFQKRAIYRLEQGNCVMVAAHTSAGKTAVAEYAIALSRRHMTKTIYTSPIKSLSNQKYRDFKLKFGDVGVVTGDVQLNRNASCLIMTTEVLQAMLYNGEKAVQDVEWVIFDEVHYINDPERGSVWEEVIMKLPDTVSIIMLSATVPNYLEFANWVGRTKQKKVYVQYTDKRPVPLMHHLMLEGKLSIIKNQEQPVDQTLLKKLSAARSKLKFGDANKNPPQYQAKQAEIDQKSQEEKLKKIDFKEKAIKAKEGAMKKMLAKHTSGGGQAKGPNQGAGKKKSNSFQKTLEQIEKMKLLPCIVFAFSRAGTFQFAEGLDPSIDYTDGYTKGLIRKFIKQKLQRLDEADRDLPQIKKVTGLLIRGIGVHHAGLLQVLREFVEILFSDGYLKVVFATSTFAIGLNLPARSVVFTQMKKFNGTEKATIEASEYLQMAGRAGRRGKDDRGFSIICADPEMGALPSNTEMLDLLDSKGIELSSQLRIDYRTCLNVLKQEQGEIGSMLQSSFFANEDMSIKLQNIKHKKHIEPLFEKTKSINCIHGAPEEAKKVFDLIDQLWAVNYQLNTRLAPVAMQIVEVTTAKHILRPMIVLKVQLDRCLCLFAQKASESWPLQYDEKISDESLSELQKRNQPKQVGTDQGIFSYEYVQVYFDMISKFYVNTLDIDKLHFVQANQVNEKQLKIIIQEFSKIKVLKEDVPPGKKRTMAAARDRQQDIIRQMKETKCWGCDLLSYHITQTEVHAFYKKEMDGIMKVLSGGVDIKENDFNIRNGVLMEYKIIDQELNMTFKGKVATKADNIILCEFFFSGLISQVTDCELLALLSIFCINERAGGTSEDCSKQYSENFTKASNFILKETEKLLQLETELGIETEENTIEKRTNYKFYEMVYDWADQKTFAEVIEGSSIDDGIIVKLIMSVNRQRQKVQEMATFVGDNSLAERMKGMQDLIDRGIVKMQSLYLEVDQEPQRLNYQNEEMAEVKYEESKI